MQEIKTLEYLKPLYAYKWTLRCIIEDDIKQHGRQDIMHDLTFSGAHIGVAAKGKIALLCVTSSQQGAWMMAHNNLISEQK